MITVMVVSALGTRPCPRSVEVKARELITLLPIPAQNSEDSSVNATVTQLLELLHIKGARRVGVVVL